MRLRLCIAHNETIRELITYAPEDTLENFLHAALPHEHIPNTVWVDDQETSIQERLEELALYDGTRIADYCLPPLDDTTNQWCVSVTEGDGAGNYIFLEPAHTYTIGRSGQADIHSDNLTVSWLHAAMTIEDDVLYVRDCDSSNGTWFNGEKIGEEAYEIPETGGILTCGGIVLYLQQGIGQHKVTVPPVETNKATTISFNRPPRQGTLEAPSDISAPQRKSASTPSRFSWAAVLAPLLMAGVLVVMMGNARFALIALLSPLIAVFTWYENKRHHKKEQEKKRTRIP